MKNENRMFRLLCLAVVMCLFGLLTISAQTATSFSGNATGVIANATVAGTVTTNATVAPTGALPSTGGRQTAGVPVSATIDLRSPATANAALTTGVVTTRTSGGLPGGAPDGGGANTSQSQAVVNDLNLNVAAAAGINAGLSVTAATITADTNCSCGPTCTGSSVVENLTVNGQVVGTDIIVPGAIVTTVNGRVRVAAAPNTQISLLGGTLIIKLNEQTFNGPGDLTVNALRVQANLLGVTTDIIVAQAHSDITCNTAPAGSADLVVTNVCTTNNDVVTCVITVTNNGPDTANNVSLTNTTPSTLTFVSATQTGGFTLSTPPVGTMGGTVTGTLATLPSGQSATITVVSNVSPNTTVGTSIVTTATATSTTPDPTTGNNTVTATITNTAATATGFSGDATGVIANANILGGTAIVNALVAPTGAISTSGGRLTNGVATIALDLDGPLAIATLNTGVVITRSSGGPAGIVDGGTANTSQSQAVVNDLDLALDLLADIDVTADTITANTNCRCTNTGPVCAGSSIIEDLRVNGVIVPILDASGNATITPAPNTEISLLGGTLILRLNEQIFDGPGDITVNALRILINVPNPFPGGPPIATTDIVVSQAHSDIVCTLIPTTAASASISGRVLTSNGRGLPGVTVVLTDLNGELNYASTNSRGFYRFSDVAVGENYILSVSSKRYGFTTQNVFVTEDLIDINFMPRR